MGPLIGEPPEEPFAYQKGSERHAFTRDAVRRWFSTTEGLRRSLRAAA